MRATRTLVLLVAVVLAVTGCRYQGLSSLPLPFSPGSGDGAVRVAVHLRQAANLVPNAEVKVGDVTVGTVTRIRYVDGHARLDLTLAPATGLPGDAVARVGQKTLLGAEFLELAPPPGRAGVGRLRDGDEIPLSRTGRHPETEEVLAALAGLLNGGGLAQIRTITTELGQALGGREPRVRALVGDLDRLVGTLEAQKGDIVRTVDALDRFSGTLAAGRRDLGRAIDTLPGGLAVIEQDRERLVASTTAVADAGSAAARVLRESRGDLVATTEDLRTVLGRLADSGQALTRSSSILGTFPIPTRTGFPSAVKGDYTNAYLVLDLDPATLARNLLAGFRVPGPLGTTSLGAGLAPSTLLPPGLLEPVVGR